jgi:nucleoside-diphosphate-sugar epimerase
LVTILGLGFTGKRVARRLLARGVPVFAAVRGLERFEDLAAAGLRLTELKAANLQLDGGTPDGFPVRVPMLYSIPPTVADDPWLRSFRERLAPSRIVYISSTGVYGEQTDVHEETAAQPNDERGRLRLAAEREIADGPWTTLILRAAAIYGPGRGVQTAIREGRMPRSSGSGVVSRIHVDDLAALAEAGLFSELEGAFPVADEAPCSSEEIAAWCRGYFGMPPGEASGGFGVAGLKAAGLKAAGRRVDGRKVRELLGVTLKYPTWETGVPASIVSTK